MPANETTLLSGAPEDATSISDDTAYAIFLETTDQIAQNWKAILISGILNFITGTLCLLFPVFATEVAQLFLTSLILTIGLLNTLTICTDRQSPLIWVGLVQILLALLMVVNPFVTLSVLTYFVAVVFMLLGSLQIAVARLHGPRMAARALMMLSGAASILMSLLICMTLSTAKYYTLGILFGVNIFNVGVNRILIGLYGRKIASSDGSHENWQSYLDRDVV